MRAVKADLTHATPDEFRRFWFERPIDQRAVGPDADSSLAWYWGGVEIDFDPQRHAANFTRLFEMPEPLDLYSDDRLEEGFWAMVSPLAVGGLPSVLWSAHVPWPTRHRLVRSMGRLFARLFARRPLETASYMWWDMLAFDLHYVGAAEARHFPDAARVHEVMFEVVREILEVDAEPCRRAALHGFNHLRHSRTEDVVCGWLARHPALGAELVAYARECARFAAE